MQTGEGTSYGDDLPTTSDRNKLAFHGADTDTDTDSTPTRPTRLYILTSDTRDFLATILARKSVSALVSKNASCTSSSPVISSRTSVLFLFQL